jgi:hypothetical protein
MLSNHASFMMMKDQNDRPGHRDHWKNPSAPSRTKRSSRPLPFDRAQAQEQNCKRLML